MLGYSAEEYARSLVDIGEPRQLPRSGGWLLVRKLPESVLPVSSLASGSLFDAIGCYPMFSCSSWERLAEDLEELPREIISISIVTDSASEVTPFLLTQSFPDVCYRYKDHFFADLTRPLDSYVSSHHRRNARQAAKSLRVERLDSPVDHLSSWVGMYDVLVDRHGIGGFAAFSRESFDRQLRVPGLRAYAAFASDEMVGMILWMVDQQTAYYHLAAYTELGYSLKASFALFDHCLTAFSQEGILQAALGGGAGTFTSSDGLARFKQGWSSDTRPTYFCGRILDRNRYMQLVSQTGFETTSFFPAYRAPRQTSAA